MSEHVVVSQSDEKTVRIVLVGAATERKQTVIEAVSDDQNVSTFDVETMAAALDVLAGHQPRCLVTAQQLPDGSGVELCKQVTTLSPETGTVLLVGEDEEEVAATAIEAGVDSYVRGGPEYDPVQFKAAIRTAIERGQNTQTEFLRRFRALQGASQDLTAASSVKEACEIAVTVARDALDLPLSGIHLRDGDRLEPVVITEEVNETFGAPPAYTPEDDAFVWSAYERQESKRFRQTEEIDDVNESETPVRSGMILSLGEHGIHLLTSTSPKAFSETDRFFADLLASTTEAALDRVEATERLRSERDRFARLFESVPESVIRYRFENGDPVIEAVNEPFETVFGYDESEVRGQPVDELLVPAEERTVANEINDRAADGERVQREVMRNTTDGPRPFLLRNAPWDDGEGGYAVYIDISDRKEREETITALHGATRSLVRADSPEAIAEVVVETVRDVVGVPYAAVFRYFEADDELRAVNVSDESIGEFGPPPTFEPEDGIVGKVFSSGDRIVLDDAQGDKRGLSGGNTDIRSYCVLPLGSHGVMTIAAPEPGEIAENTVEIAELLASNAATALDRIERESELRAREARLRQQNERLEAFASVVSHDLRNPLTVLSGSIDLAESTGDPEHFEHARDAIDRMEGLIDDLLVLARQGEVVDDRQPTAVEGVVKSAWQEVPTEDATLDVRGELVTSADPDRLRQLFANLFRNAVEHGGDGVSVTFGTFEDGFYVADDGPGIPPDQREQVFNHGFTTSSGGTGLGLKIVDDIAGAHGWRVAVTESDDGGARFEVHGVVDTSFDAN